MNSRPSIPVAALHIATLSGFAFAQPLYDLLGHNAEFFVAHGCRPGDVLPLVGALSVLLPAVLILAWLLACPGSLRSMGHMLVVSGLAAVIALQAGNRLDGVAGRYVLARGLALCHPLGVSHLRLPPWPAFPPHLSPP